jgi:peptidoglycan/LPS O-acetylase OafA/YrhL
VQQKNNSVYFPGLNGLRFLAAFVVAICHVEQRKMDLGFANFFNHYFFYNAAGLGVTLFFVLSGFLITYLLLVEKNKCGRISLKSFYIRRILRIWPLYYLIVILACFILPHIPLFDLRGEEIYNTDFAFRLLMLLLILPNVLHITGSDVPYSGQTWSIGVEEQFYLIWPFIFQRVKKYYLTLMLLIVLIVLLANGFLYIANNCFTNQQKQYSGAYKTLHFIGEYFTFFRISSMAIGGIGACLLFFNHRLKAVFVNPAAELAAWVALVVLMMLRVKISYVYHEFYSCLFFVIILNACSGRSVLHNVLENRVINYCGKISYGIYMYHGIVIVVMIKFFYRYLGVSFNWWQTILLDIFVVSGTVFIAALSYRFFESPLIKLKERFQRVRSGTIQNVQQKAHEHSFR